MLLLLAPARRVMIRAAWVLLAALLAAVAGATALNNSLGLTPQVRSRGGRYTRTHTHVALLYAAETTSSGRPAAAHPASSTMQCFAGGLARSTGSRRLWAVRLVHAGGCPADPHVACPQMGFNSWNQLGCNYDEVKIRAVADALVSSGLSSVGYRYLVLDDCWMDHARNTSVGGCPTELADIAPRLGCWQFDRRRFPSGGEALISYVHSKGLLFGLYSSAGPKTCQGLPASLGREEADARWLAAMKVDYLKYDNCGSEGISEKEQRSRFKAMSDAILANGRPTFMSLCEWNGHTGNPFDWVRELGNSWRTNGDINAHWDSVLYEADHADIDDEGQALADIAGPGGWYAR